MYVFKTRSRIERTKVFIENYKKTNGSSKIYVRLDNDDPFLNEYLDINWPNTFIVCVDNRCMLGEAMQEMFIKHPNEYAYGLVADDFIPIDNQWDSIAEKSTNKRKIVCWNEYLVDKPIAPKKFEHMVVGGDLVRHIGWFGMPCTKHYYQDIIWRYIAKEIKGILIYLDNIKVIHDHPKSLNYQYTESLSLLNQDTENFDLWIKNNFFNLISHIKTF